MAGLNFCCYVSELFNAIRDKYNRFALQLVSMLARARKTAFAFPFKTLNRMVVCALSMRD
jgi:hypothetical protein